MPVPGPEFESVRGPVGKEPVQRFCRRPGPEPVVLAGHGTEGPAEFGRGLVLAHEAQSSEDGAIARRRRPEVDGSRARSRQAGGRLPAHPWRPTR